MSNIGTSMLLLLVAILLLWLAVTDRLSNLIDGFNVAIGKETAVASTVASNVSNGATGAVAGVTKLVHLDLPALPSIGSTANVGIA